MIDLYWGCFTGGILFAVISLIFGDVLSDIFDGIFDAVSFDHADFIHPMVIVGGITVFGGSGILLSQYTRLEPSMVAWLSLLSALIISAVVYFAYVKPMKNSENSTGFSVQDLVGKIGEVVTPVPGNGCGEILIRIGAGNTNQIAASLDGEELSMGTRVVVGEVKDHVLYVFPYEE